jgi:hypothetical protein
LGISTWPLLVMLTSVASVIGLCAFIRSLQVLP